MIPFSTWKIFSVSLIQSFRLQQYVEAGKVLAIKQTDKLAVRRNAARHLCHYGGDHCG